MPLATHLPPIDNRRYDEIMTEVRTRVARYAPEWVWTDVNDSDPGMTLAQIFAWLTEQLIFRMGRVPEQNYIKFLNLLGIELRPAEPALAEITFPMLPGATAPVVIVPPLMQVAADAEDGGPPIVFETDRAIKAVRAQLDALLAFDGFEYRPLAQSDDLAQPFEPFASPAKEGNAFLLGFTDPAPFPQTELDLTVWTGGDGASRTAGACSSLSAQMHPPAQLTWECWAGTWMSLTVLKDETLALTRSGHVQVRTPAPNVMKRLEILPAAGLRYWIRARIARAGYERPPRLLAIRTNTVSATQAQTVRDEVLGGSDGTAHQSFQLANIPVLDGSLEVDVYESATPERWTRVDDLFASGPESPHYELIRTTGEIRFGDGIEGRIPAGNVDMPTTNIVARTYRYGGGPRGNVAPGRVRNLMGSVAGVDATRVANLRAAHSGRAEESLEEAKKRARQNVKSRSRAVTPEDFEFLATQSANVKRAKALPLVHPEFPGVRVPGVVSVIVVPDGDTPNPSPSEGTLRNVCAALNGVRLLTTEVFVVRPKYRLVRISGQVIAEPQADLGEVTSAIDTSLTDYFHPLRGGDRGDGWPFGGNIFFSRVYQRVLTVKDVARIERIVITLDGETARDCTDVPLCDSELLYSTGHDVQVSYAEGE
jgi:predicted phage baseplate assembly protein